MICKNTTWHKLCGAARGRGQEQPGATVVFTDRQQCILEKNTIICVTNKSGDP